MRVVTYNIHGGRPISGPPDLHAIAAVVRSLEPDLVGLQEVHRYVPPPGIFQDQPHCLAELLGMHVTFRRSLGVGRAGYGNAVFSKAPPLRVRRTLLPSEGEQRALVEVWLEVAGTTLRFLNMHFGLTPGQRREQARTVAARVREKSGPLVLVGDLNAEPGSEEVRTLEDAGLAHCLPPEVRTFPSDVPVERLDYVMTTSHFRAAGWDVPSSPASDHLPVLAALEWA